MNGSNSFTRLTMPYDRSHRHPSPDMQPGMMRTEMVNGVAQTWAISRPVQARIARPPGGLLRGGPDVVLLLPRPHIEMDPTNPLTWQREYRFTS